MRTVSYFTGALVEALAWCWRHKGDLAGAFVLLALIVELWVIASFVAAMGG